MKPFLLLLCFLPITVVAQNHEQAIIGQWNGGEAFGGEYEDFLLIFSFDTNSFQLNYGPNTFKHFTGYEIKHDTLVLLESIKYQNSAFKIISLTNDSLILEVLNWPAIYVVNILCSPYLTDDIPLIPIHAGYDTEAVLQSEGTRKILEFIKLVN